ncbi:MAG TPA: DUF305 domain-containing protein [Ornithinibacter sp.]|nr:DUF305 domain-containing protein [Ornithinibacter sp.]
MSRPLHSSTASSRPVRLAAVLAMTAASFGLAGCTGDDAALPAVTASSASVPVLQPGRPGEPNATVTGSAAAPTTTVTARPADARFYQEMIVHHAQALVMVRSVLPDLTDPQVKSLADRIGDEQEPEIAAMSSWLEGRGQDVPPEATNPNLTDHGSHAMPGMASAAELSRLATASGADADRLFLGLMIRHHQGALAMVDEHAKNAADERVEETAAEIHVTQSKQIAQMQEMLDRLG